MLMSAVRVCRCEFKSLYIVRLIRGIHVKCWASDARLTCWLFACWLR